MSSLAVLLVALLAAGGVAAVTAANSERLLALHPEFFKVHHVASTHDFQALLRGLHALGTVTGRRVVLPDVPCSLPWVQREDPTQWVASAERRGAELCSWVQFWEPGCRASSAANATGAVTWEAPRHMTRAEHQQLQVLASAAWLSSAATITSTSEGYQDRQQQEDDQRKQPQEEEEEEELRLQAQGEKGGEQAHVGHVAEAVSRRALRQDDEYDGGLAGGGGGAGGGGEGDGQRKRRRRRRRQGGGAGGGGGGVAGGLRGGGVGAGAVAGEGGVVAEGQVRRRRRRRPEGMRKRQGGGGGGGGRGQHKEADDLYRRQRQLLQTWRPSVVVAQGEVVRQEQHEGGRAMAWWRVSVQEMEELARRTQHLEVLFVLDPVQAAFEPGSDAEAKYLAVLEACPFLV